MSIGRLTFLRAAGAALLGLGISLTGIIALARAKGARAVLFPTGVLRKVPAEPRPYGGEIWTLQTEEGEVEAFFFPAETRGPAVIFAHGNGELIDDQVPLGRFYQTRGISVLIPEYRGYGRSSGTPTESAVVEDFAAFHRRLVSDTRVDPARVSFHGRSLGGAVVAALTGRQPPASLLLESTFTSVRELARERGIPGFLVGPSFDSATALADWRGPTLIVHGRGDSIVPFGHAEELHRRLPASRLVALDCGHNDCAFPEAEGLELLGVGPR